MRILLTGAKGQVSHFIKQQKPEHWEMIAADSKTLDITNPVSVNNMVHSFEPDVIFNTAGYTNLEAAEHDKEQVFAVNAEGTRLLAQAAASAGIRFITISSDYVFDGQKRSPYSESDYPNPLSTYAKSKLAGELLALAANPESIIIRSSWVFSEYGNNVVTDLVRRAQGSHITMPTDKVGCPTYAGDLANVMIQLASNRHAPRGIFHYCGDKAVNRFEFAQMVLKELSNLTPVSAELIAITAANTETTPRPPYSVLSCDKLRTLGYAQSDWQAALKRILPDMVAR